MAGQPLRLAIVASLDAKGVSAGAAETRREVESVGQSAAASAGQIRLLAAANDEAAAAQRRAIDAARGRSAAETELQQSIARMTGMRPMLEDAGMGRRTADISAYGEALDDLRAKYNPLFAAQRQYEANLAAIGQALKVGAISQAEHAAAVTRTEAAYRLQQAAIAANDVSLVRSAQALRDRTAAETELQASIARMTGMRPMLDDAGTAGRAADISAYGEALDDLRAKYNPLFAAERERERGLTAINQALRLGAISQDEHAVAVGRANAVYQQQVAAIAANDIMLVRSAQGTRLQAHEVGNLSSQLTDMAVMLASGQSPWLMMVQQGSQVSQIMGNRGLGSILPALASGIGAMVNPTMLALGAVTALGYGATAAFAAMQSDIVQVDKLVSDHEDTIRRIKAAWGDAATGLQPYARESRAVLDLVMRVAAEDRRSALRDLTPGALAGVTSAVNVSDFGGARAFRQSETFKVLREEIDALNKAASDGVPDFVGFQRRMAELERSDPSPKVRALAAAAIEATKEVADLQRSLPEAQNEIDGIGGSAERAAKRIDTFQEALRALGSGNRSLTDRDRALRDYAAARGSASDREERDDAYAALQDRLRRIDNEEAGALVPTPTRRPNLEDSLPSGRDLIRTQREQLETLRLEQMLVTSGTAARERAIAAMQAEQEIRRLGIDSAGEEAEAIRSNAVAIAEQTSALERNEEAWRKSQSAAESMIDSLIDRLSSGDIEGALEGLARDLSKELLGLGAGNTIKNALLGGDRPTFADYGGPLGYLGALVGRRPATLTPTIAETGGGLLGMIGDPRATRDADKIIRLPLPPVTGTASAASGTAARELLGYLAGGRPSSYVTDMSGDLQAGLAAMLRDAPASVRSAVSITSGARSVERQAELWQQALAKYGSPEAARRWVAPPGRSQHNFGNAADLGFGSDEARQWFHSNAEGYGLRFPMGHEPWHIETANARGGNAGSRALDDLTAGAGRFGRAVDQVATSSVAAKDGIGALGQGAGQLGQNLARYFPAAPGAPAGGGIGGWLSGLLGGGAPSMAGMSAFSPLAAAAISAGRGGLYWSGGWTGPGGKYDPKGIVHADEYVFSAEATRAIGVGNLDKLHDAANRGYAEGGFEMPGSWRGAAGGAGASGGGGQQGLTVNLINQTSEPMRAERRRTPDGRGGWRDDVILKRAAIDAVTGPEGKAAMGATYGMQATMPEL